MARNWFFLFFCSSWVLGLGFVPMGNVSSSLGGAGVALRNSAWGLYYNPALLSSDPRSKFSFSLGFYIAQRNTNPLLEISPNAPTQEVEELLSSLKDANITLSSQMGVVAQIGGFFREKNVARADEYGRIITQSIKEEMSAFAIGAFGASEMNMGVVHSGGVEYEMKTLCIALMEIPVGYAYKLQTSFGDFNFGAALKYMRAVFDFSTSKGNAYDKISIGLPNFLKMSPAQNFGIDLGFLYSIADFHLGLSAKNINLPTFEINNKKIKLDPALRVGMSYEFLKNYVVTMDIDLLTQSLSGFVPKRQFLALGLVGDYRFVDFRAGFGMNILNPLDSKVALGFNVFGVLDIAGEMGFNFAKNGALDMVLPTNFGVKIGSTFTF